MRKHAIRRLFGALTAFCMALSCAGPPVAAASGAAADAPETNGGADTASPDADAELFADTNRCGPNALWTLENGVLKITGTGEMTDFSYGAAPWNDKISEIVSVEIENGIVSIGDGAFYNCSNLESVSIPDSVTSIGEGAFSTCSNLSTIQLPQTLRTIKHLAFHKCAMMSELRIPASVEKLETFLTSGSGICDFIVDEGNPYFKTAEGVLFSRDGTEFVAFPGGRFASVYEIPENVTALREGAFGGANVRFVRIPDGVTAIPSDAFYGCEYLLAVAIPESVAEIDYQSFYRCSRLADVYYAGNQEAWDAVSNFWYSYLDLTSVALHCENEGLPSIDDWNRGEWNGFSWELDSAGKLTVSGEGDMPTPQYSWERERAPWDTARVREAVISEGVTALGSCAFQDCANLQRVSIPDSVTKIGAAAFANCVSLASVKIPDTVTQIGSDAFKNCYALSSVNIPDGVRVIHYDVFKNCASLSSVVLPDALEEIEDGAFKNCAQLTSVSIPANVHAVWVQAFYGCSRLARVDFLTLEWLFISIGTFGNCPLLKDVYYCDTETHWKQMEDSRNPDSFPDGVTFHFLDPVASGTLETGLRWEIDRVGTLTVRGNGAMPNYSPSQRPPWDASAVVNVHFEEGVTEIGNYAFYNSTTLNFLYATPETMTAIGDYAFYGCPMLEEVIINFGVKRIGDCAFGNCPEIYFLGSPAEWNAIQIGTNAFPKAEIDYEYEDDPSGTCGDGLTWSLSMRSGELSIRGVGDMEEYNGIRVVIPWRNYGFYVKSVDIGEGVTSVAQSAFRDFSNAVSVTLPNSLLRIGKWAFEEFGTDDEEISIVIPDSVKEIEEQAFYGCNAESVVIGDGVTSIGDKAFSSCYKLTKVTLGQSVRQIGDDAFWHSGISDIRIPASVERVGNHICAFCKNLTSAAFEDGVKIIGLWMFDGCSNLSAVYIPASVTRIGDSAFEDCGLYDVYYGGSEEQWKQIQIEDYGNEALNSPDLKIHYHQTLSNGMERLEVTGLDGAIVTRGMPLDISALTVTAVYADGTTSPVENYALFGFNANRLGKQTVGVRYLDQETSFEITVAEAGVTGLSVSSMPTRRVYHTGDALDLSDLVLSATYSDYSTRTVTDGYSVSGYDANRVGEQSVTVSYGGQRTSLTVSVIAPETVAEAPGVGVTPCPGGQSVSLASGAVGATIWYTVDNSNPATSATRQRYRAPFALTQSATIKAYATLNGVDSDVTSVRVTVERVSDVTADRSGNVVTLRTETPGAAIWYGFDATHMTLEYSGGVVVDRDMTIFAAAKKDGWRDSETFEGSYAPEDSSGTENGVEVRLLDAEGTSGGLLSVPVYLYPDGEEDTITSFQIAIRYDSEKFELQSVQPSEGVQNLLQRAGAENGRVILYYNRIQKEESPSVEPGEVFTLFLKAKLSSTDGDYEVAVDEERTDICSSASPDSAPLRVVNGKITLSDTRNSLVRRVTALSASLSDASGDEVSSLSTPGAARTSFTLEETGAFRADGDLILNVVRAVYAQDGKMLAWDIKTHNFTLNSAFSEVMEIPSGAAGGSVRAMLLDDDLSPRASAIPLLNGVR